MKSKNETKTTSIFFNSVKAGSVFAGILIGIFTWTALTGSGFAEARGIRPQGLSKLSSTLSYDGGIGGSGGGGGGELPTPFDTANRKVELADGEAYLLAGRVILTNALGFMGEKKIMPYFRVDLSEHPWLASEKRLNHPYYPLDGTIEDWKEYISVGKIKLPCIARGVLRNDGIHFEYTIQLQRSSELPVEPMDRR